MISRCCKKLKYRRKIVLITGGSSPINTEGLDEICKKLKQDQIELIILGVDFDDPEFGVKEESKDPLKAENESTLAALAADSDGVIGTLAQAIAELQIPRTKAVRPVHSYRGSLTLGDKDAWKAGSGFNIQVERYPRTSIAAPPSASQFVEAIPNTQSTATLRGEDESNPMLEVKNDRKYVVVDESGKREVSRDELAKGYEYGRTAVHISQSDEAITKLETFPEMDLIGFVPKEKYERYMNLSVASVIIPQKMNEKAAMALSSLIHALFELESYGIARFVAKEDKEPLLILLAPSIEPDFECLIDVQLPFAEDVRTYRFPSLEKVVTVSGKVLSEHKNLPSESLMRSVSGYVDHFDICSFGRDDDGNPCEYAAMEETFSPVLHRIRKAIQWRAVHPSDTVPPAPKILTKYSSPPEDLLNSAGGILEKLNKEAGLEKVPPKQKGRKRNREVDKPMSGLDVEQLLGRERRGAKISADNAVPEFKQMLATTEDPDGIADATRQMVVVVRDLVTKSVADSSYGRVIECVGAMRAELLEFEEPKFFNDFLVDLKASLLRGDLGGDRRELWFELRRNRLGLITKRQSAISSVSEEEVPIRAIGSLAPRPYALKTLDSQQISYWSLVKANLVNSYMF
ncbi:MAG: ATP-dependent DNA helicase II subunit 2 [Trizodia sp. TS-e1964]|nr:MAG: ATP-dependent DNA helicase II subunit 2 [Trizodia sp. TS-e1964]